MRRLAVIGLLLLAGLGVYLFRGGDGTYGPGRSGVGSPPDREPPAVADDAFVPPHLTGSACLFGIVHRGVDPVPAKVEVRFRETVDPAESLRTVDLDLAWLSAVPASGPAIATGQAGEGGEYRIEGLAPGHYDVRAVTADGASGVAWAEIRVPGESVRADPGIPGGSFVLRGRAVYADGSPFVGLVSAGWEEIWAAPVSPPVRTEPDGSFTIPGLWPGAVRPVARLGGKSFSLGEWLRTPFPGELLFVVDEGFREIAGRVLSEVDDRPLSGAVVLAGGEDEGTFAVVRAVADEKGRFRIRVPPDDIQMAVRAPGFTPGTFYPNWLGGGDWTIRLSQSGQVSGTVVGEDGQGRGEVPVFLVPLDRDEESPVRRTVSGAAGAFEFADVPEGVFTLVAFGNGWTSRGTDGFGATWQVVPGAFHVPSEGATGRTLGVSPATRVEGRVTDAGGPAAGVTVEARPWEHRDDRLSEILVSRAVSGPDGRFTFETIEPGLAWTVVAKPGTPCESDSGPFVGASGETIAAEIELDSPRAFDLLVVEEGTGAPLAGAQASVFVGSGWRPESDFGHTDSKGRMLIGPLPRGRMILDVHHEDYVSSDRLTFPPGPLPEQVRVGLDRGLAVGGRVVFPDGSPAPGADVSGGESRRLFSTMTGRRGEFLIRGLAKRSFPIAAHVWRGNVLFEAELPGVAAGDLDVEVRLVPEGEEPEQLLRFVVLDPDGRPVPSAKVSLCSADGPIYWFSDVAGGRGECRLTNSISTIEIEVWGARSASGRPLPLGPVGLGPIPVPAEELEIRLPPERRIEGRVIDEAGEGVGGVLLSVSKGNSVQVRSRADGTFSIGGLGAGSCEIQPFLGRGWLTGGKVRAEPGGDPIEIRVRRADAIAVTVLDERDLPMPRVKVEVYPQFELHPVPILAYTDRQGVARFRLERGLPIQRLTVFAPASRPELVHWQDYKWTISDTVVRLQPGLFITGMAEQASGRPPWELSVWGHPEKGATRPGRRAEVDAAGAFRIGPFPEGPVKLELLLWVGSSYHRGGEVTVPAGAVGVSLRFPER